jgi:tripartite-type tricarboxylate transporter receptor subunit TctC
MVKDPEVITKLANIGSTPLYMNGTAAKEHVMKEAEEVEKLFSLK